MNNWTDSIFKRVWNVAIHVIGNFLSFVINTSAYQWADMSLHLLLLKSSMVYLVLKLLATLEIIWKTFPLLSIISDDKKDDFVQNYQDREKRHKFTEEIGIN